MPKFTDLSGRQFGAWNVVRLAERKRGGSVYECVCKCGTIRLVHRSNLVAGKTQSCGCEKAAKIAEKRTTHGHSRSINKPASKVYNCWSSMIDRCSNPRNSAYDRYGGRGIIVCERWKSFENFLADMGNPYAWQSIDRINVNGNYEPDNCRWASDKQQARNTRRTKFTEQMVTEIRAGKIGVAEAINMTGCSRSAYYMAKRGNNWK